MSQKIENEKQSTWLLYEIS